MWNFPVENLKFNLCHSKLVQTGEPGTICEINAPGESFPKAKKNEKLLHVCKRHIPHIVHPNISLFILF